VYENFEVSNAWPLRSLKRDECEIFFNFKKNNRSEFDECTDIAENEVKINESKSENEQKEYELYEGAFWNTYYPSPKWPKVFETDIRKSYTPQIITEEKAFYQHSIPKRSRSSMGSRPLDPDSVESLKNRIEYLQDHLGLSYKHCWLTSKVKKDINDFVRPLEEYDILLKEMSDANFEKNLQTKVFSTARLCACFEMEIFF